MAVAAIVALALSLAALNIWFRHATTSRIHRHWGTAAMQRIALARRATWCELDPHRASGDPTTAASAVAADSDREPPVFFVDGSGYRIVRQGDLVSARGFTNMRHALGQDGSYDWDSPADASSPTDWQWAVVFADGDREAGDDEAGTADANAETASAAERTVLLFDLDGRRVRTLDDADAVVLTAKMADGLKTFFAEQVVEGNAPPERRAAVSHSQ